jgi:hydroxymethylglutaryl-CoA synthase
MYLLTSLFYRFAERVVPSCRINQNVGNCYTGSVFSSLLSVINDKGAELGGKRILMFSYGSGSMASLYRYDDLFIPFLIVSL